jgi:mannose-6-phosphate isomerase-like protein (cupin superfamily)
MRVVRPSEFRADRAWGADEIAAIDGATVRLHWTDEPYVWHVNDGEEVFVVVDGEVDMHVCVDGVEEIHRLTVGDVFHADAGTEHVARPVGECRVLVVERAGSI